jgi:hypothetical protein
MNLLGKIDFNAWPNCHRNSNDNVELVVTTDVGLRILRFGWTGDENELAV